MAPKKRAKKSSNGSSEPRAKAAAPTLANAIPNLIHKIKMYVNRVGKQRDKAVAYNIPVEGLTEKLNEGVEALREAADLCSTIPKDFQPARGSLRGHALAEGEEVVLSDKDGIAEKYAALGLKATSKMTVRSVNGSKVAVEVQDKNGAFRAFVARSHLQPAAS